MGCTINDIITAFRDRSEASNVRVSDSPGHVTVTLIWIGSVEKLTMAARSVALRHIAVGVSWQVIANRWPSVWLRWLPGKTITVESNTVAIRSLEAP